MRGEEGHEHVPAGVPAPLAGSAPQPPARAADIRRPRAARARRTGGEEEAPVARVGRSVRPVERSAAPGSRQRGGAGRGPRSAATPLVTAPSAAWLQVTHSRLSGPRGAARCRRRSLAAELRLRDERTVGWTEEAAPRGARPAPDPVQSHPRGGAPGPGRGSPERAPRLHLRALRGMMHLDPAGDR